MGLHFLEEKNKRTTKRELFLKPVCPFLAKLFTLLFLYTLGSRPLDAGAPLLRGGHSGRGVSVQRADPTRCLPWRIKQRRSGFHSDASVSGTRGSVGCSEQPCVRCPVTPENSLGFGPAGAWVAGLSGPCAQVPVPCLGAGAGTHHKRLRVSVMLCAVTLSGCGPSRNRRGCVLKAPGQQTGDPRDRCVLAVGRWEPSPGPCPALLGGTLLRRSAQPARRSCVSWSEVGAWGRGWRGKGQMAQRPRVRVVLSSPCAVPTAVPRAWPCPPGALRERRGLGRGEKGRCALPPGGTWLGPSQAGPPGPGDRSSAASAAQCCSSVCSWWVSDESC